MKSFVKRFRSILRIFFREKLAFFLVSSLITGFACSALAQSGREIFRIKVHNTFRGVVQVSIDGGSNFTTVGRVVRPAKQSIESFPAAAYTPAGAVAATSVHGIRIKTSQIGIGTSAVQTPFTFSIVPKEFSVTPKGFGGHVPGDSGIYTDIPAGTSIFRQFAPFVGNPVYVLDSSGALSLIPGDYSPKIGDTIVIIANQPDRQIEEIIFENRKNGAVTAKYADGSSEQITSVLSPVRGVGRYDGTSYTGVGAINTNHGGVITISTAPLSRLKLPEGQGPERRGGFMVQPSNHAKTQGKTSPTVMVVGSAIPGATPLEGRPPLFREFISLAFDPQNAASSFLVQCKIDDGNWEILPSITGKVDDAFEARYLNEYFKRQGSNRRIKTGVTALRIKFPVFDREYLGKVLTASERKYSEESVQLPTPGRKGVVSGVLTINANLSNLERTMFVAFYIDGELKSMTNSPPFAYDWDTTEVSNGEHEIEVRALDENGHTISKTTSRVTVANP